MKPATSFPRQNEKGAIMVEFAIMLPLLVLLLAGIIDFGLLIREHQLLQNAAREGARFSSLERNQIATAGDATAQAAVLDGIKQRVSLYLQAETNTIPQAGAGVTLTVTISQTETIDLGDGTSIGASKIKVSY